MSKVKVMQLVEKDIEFPIYTKNVVETKSVDNGNKDADGNPVLDKIPSKTLMVKVIEGKEIHIVLEYNKAQLVVVDYDELHPDWLKYKTDFPCTKKEFETELNKIKTVLGGIEDFSIEDTVIIEDKGIQEEVLTNPELTQVNSEMKIN